MKKFFKVTLALVVLVSAVSMFSSCSDPDPVPTDVINDETGIKIDLDWTTGGTINESLTEADLDLYLYKGESTTTTRTSTSSSAFEHIELDPEDLEDGTYKVAVYLFDNDENVSYTVTVNGQTASKPITFTSTFAAEDDNREVKGLSITKSGSKYTVKEL